MKTFRIFCLFFSVVLLLSGYTEWRVTALNPLPTIDVTVNTNDDRIPISPYIYGINGVEPAMTQGSARSGGNRLTGYNWHNNYSSAGSDWQHYNDDFLANGLPAADKLKPAMTLIDFAQKSAEAGTYSLVTLPMAGYVARDNKQTVTADETAPSERFAKIEDRKPGGDFTLEPDISADTVYSDELLNYLITTLGDSSAATGIKGYCLDNEPALWSETHPRIHPKKVTVDELIKKSISLSSVVKDFDPGADIFGPVLYGFNAYMSLQNAEDWKDTYKSQYNWFIDCYLDKMREAEAAQGRRLLDVLDLHYYSEAQNQAGERVSFGNQTDEDSVYTRVQSTRSLWDADYKENSWIGQWFSQFLPLLPKTLSSIDEYYPGTKLSFTEYSFGAENHISGGIAIADALGIFAENNVYLATLWPLTNSKDYAISAINLFTNADGNGLAFGDTLLPIENNKSESASIYASEDAEGNIHLMLIGKNLTQQTQFNVRIDGEYHIGAFYTLDSNSTAIRANTDGAAYGDNLLTVTVPPLSVSHLVLASGGAQTETPDGETPPAPTPEEPTEPETSLIPPSPDSTEPSTGGGSDWFTTTIVGALLVVVFAGGLFAIRRLHKRP